MSHDLEERICVACRLVRFRVILHSKQLTCSASCAAHSGLAAKVRQQPTTPEQREARRAERLAADAKRKRGEYHRGKRIKNKIKTT